MRSLIAVIGEGTTSHPEIATLAEEVGRLIAEAGFGLICGGAGTLSDTGHALRLGRRAVGLRTWETAIAGRLSGVLIATTPQDALGMALVPA